ncbi:TPA: hypothetical protein NJV08_002224 [Corynebacterium striatum]|nr:hypothetical protein [Corynebacterium striatum]HCG2979474.1 hypothetical protein [Corynebacterium striatum]HCG2992856.1 hypothetical protein [Corynebacterium striatum]HCG2995510.1 hypothetical protein [Corynebacterium striatum]HCH2243575.1 hypothetical protein [Corynebacterium striatum]
MRRPYFVADSASVTVLHSVASSAFGKYSLTVPDGVDIEDVYTLSAPGNELGYVAQLAPEGRRVGGFARRFVRADVSVRSIGESNDDTWTAASDVDTTLKEAASRVQGDFFLESDISLAGLGPWVPFEHFDVGDIADVEIWGRVVPLPVTRIEPIVSDHSIVDWRIHVGGQLVSDDEARLAENDVVRRAVVDSRRDLAGVAEAASKAVETASSAVSKADAAQGTADSAVGDAAALREVLSGAGATADDVRSQLVELNRKIQERGESQDSLPLIPAYIAANTARWRVQDELDALQDEQIALTRRLAEANRKALEIQAEMNAVFARRRPQVLSFSKNGAGNDLVTVKTGGNLTVTAKGSWTGVIAVSARVDALSAYAINDAVEVTSWQRSWEWKVGTFESSGGGYVIIMPN